MREQASERVRECERQGVRKRENEKENLLSVCYGHNMTQHDRERASEQAREQDSTRAREQESVRDR